MVGSAAVRGVFAGFFSLYPFVLIFESLCTAFQTELICHPSLKHRGAFQQTMPCTDVRTGPGAHTATTLHEGKM